MKTHSLVGLLVFVLMLSLTAQAAAQCADRCNSCSTCDQCLVEDGTSDFIEVGLAYEDVTGSYESYDQLGVYPEDWFVSGKMHWTGNDCWNRERFELRIQDATHINGRGWGRLSVYPLTLEFDGYILDNYAWNQYDELALQDQESNYDRVELRMHKGEFDNMLLAYESREFNREGTPPLYEFSYEKFAYKYNFNIPNSNIRGSFRQVGQSTDAPRVGSGESEKDSSVLKLEADLSENVTIFGKGKYTQFDYDYMPDSEFYSSDYTLSMRFKPDCDWIIETDYRTKDYADDNTVSSHVEGVDSYGAQVTYLPGAGNRIEAGYRHHSVDYLRLDVSDPAIQGILRGSAQVTPADVASGATTYSPERDEVWLSTRWNVTPRLVTDTRISFSDGDNVGTDLVAADSAGLFFDQQFKRSSNWYYDVNGNDQLALIYSVNETTNDIRGSNFDTYYLEGSWSRCTGGDGYLTLAVSSSDADLETTGISEDYTSSDITYLASYAATGEKLDYGLDVALTNGSDESDYDQLAVGADFGLKELGPVGIRLDWFDRNYSSIPLLDTEAFEVAVTYKLSF